MSLPLQIPKPTANKGRRVESTVSINTGQKIKKLLDAGNAIYLGVDPRDCARVLRDSLVPGRKNSNSGNGGGRSGEKGGILGVGGGGGGGGGIVNEKKGWGKIPDDEEKGSGGVVKRVKGLWQECLNGSALDPVAKVVLLVGLYLAGHMLFNGLRTFVSRASAHGGITFLVAILQVIWGVYFGAVCVFGMSIMWSKLRRSPAAALIFLMLWLFTTILVVVLGALWLYFYYTARNRRISKCHSQTVRAGNGFFDPNAPRRSAPQEQIDACVSMAKRGGMTLMMYGVAHMLTAVTSLLVLVWAKSYRSRLLQIEEFEQRLQEEECTEKVGLVIGTSPLGFSKPSPSPPPPPTPPKPQHHQVTRLSPTLEEEEERLSPLGVLLHQNQRDGETMVVGDRRRTLTISMGSGILPVSARHSDIYGEMEVGDSPKPKQKLRQPSPLAPRASPRPLQGTLPRPSPQSSARSSPTSSARSSPALKQTAMRSNRIL